MATFAGAAGEQPPAVLYICIRISRAWSVMGVLTADFPALLIFMFGVPPVRDRQFLLF